MLGAFRLERPIGAGGQGTVWRAEHAATGTPVGIKVLSTMRSRDDAALAAFRREVRAAAGLDHPGIITVLDQGRVPDGLDGHMDLAAGSPWLAMELARTSLDAQPGPYPWPETRALLGAILDALAHAHARGLVHRDMKPANVLFMEAPRGAAGLSRARIADFGLAFGRDDALDPARRAMAGTPLYMAPEQFRGELAELGPWSDLYAIGWMAWELTTGQHPLAGLEIIDIRAQKTMGALPSLAGDAAAPVGFEAWLRRMLHLDPRQRYRWAADARAALFALPDDAPDPPLPVLGGLDRPPTTAGMSGPTPGSGVPSSERTWDAELTTEELVPVSWHAGEPVEEAEAAPIHPATLPADWRTRAREVRPALQGAGLGLFGQRTLPLLGRDATCTALWRALRETAASRRPTAVLLHGPAGVGTTRLAEWLAERAEEVAAVDTLRLTPDPEGAHDGLDRVLARRFGIGALPAADARARLLRGLYRLGLTNPVDHRPLLELVDLEEERIANTAERHAALRALVLRLGRDRPVVLHVDDAAAGTQALRFVRSLADRDDLPLLIVLSTRDEDLAEAPGAAESIAALAPRRLAVPPLTPTHQRALVRAALHIDDDLLGALVERTAGNPGFARQLLTDWVDRDLFEPHPTGLRLAAGRTPALPDGVYAAWTGRIERLRQTQGDTAVACAELAAVLGQEVSTAVWLEACRRHLDTDTTPLLEVLFDEALATPGRDPAASWRFTHSMLRECLLRRAMEQGAAKALHAVCAEVLAEHGAPAHRVGMHLHAAEQLQAALPSLITGATDAIEADASILAGRLVAAARQAIGRLGLGETHGAAHRVRLLEATQQWRGGHFRAAEAILATLHGVALDGDPRLACEVLAGRVQTALGVMDGSGSRARAAALHEAATRAGIREFVIAAEIAMAQAATIEGRWDGARALWAGLAERQEESPPNQRAKIAFGPIQLAVSRGDLDTAASLCGPAMEYLRSTGQRRRLGQVQNTHGDILRKKGDLTGAAEAYRAAERTFEVLSSAYGTAPRINLGLTLLAAEDFEEAGVALRRALGDVRAQGHAGYEYAVRHALLPVAAARRDRPRADEHLAAIAELRARGHFLDGDLATTAEQAGDLWHRAWDPERAAACWDLAHDQWQGLGNAEAAARTARKRDRGARHAGLPAR
jgi:serine/threonine protein kinase/tetratricopeptide (TPR) repeat protein